MLKQFLIFSIGRKLSSDLLVKTLDNPPPMPYNMWVINGTPMSNTECVQGIVIDVCTRSFLLLSDEGNEKMVECETVNEFMNVLEVVTANLSDDQIEYADLAIQGEEY